MLRMHSVKPATDWQVAPLTALDMLGEGGCPRSDSVDQQHLQCMLACRGRACFACIEIETWASGTRPQNTGLACIECGAPCSCVVQPCGHCTKWMLREYMHACWHVHSVGKGERPGWWRSHCAADLACTGSPSPHKRVCEDRLCWGSSVVLCIACACRAALAWCTTCYISLTVHTSMCVRVGLDGV
jgi:hypothetical protein